MKSLLASVVLFALSTTAQAAIVNIDLSSATSGASIVAPGGSFATSFAGQTVSGIDLSGLPTGPLTLVPSGILAIDPFSPGVSPSGNSILPQPGNTAPLSILLDSNADSLELTMGFANPGPGVTISFFTDAGTLVSSSAVTLVSGYGVYSFSGLGTFRGVSFDNNVDSGGLQFMNISYNSVTTTQTPEPASLALLGAGLLGLGFARRRAA